MPWSWEWPLDASSNSCGCCGGPTPTSKVMCVATFLRINIPGSGPTPGTSTDDNQTIAAFDGTSGTVLWYYDTGFTSSGNLYIPGRAIIDSAGNVYVAINGIAGGSSISTKLLKLDKTGTLQWTYDPGASTLSSGYTSTGAQLNATYLISGICFDSAGNIVFTRYCSDATNFIYAVKVDPTGALVQNYSTHNTGFGGFADGASLTGGSRLGPPGTLVADASDNLYWIDVNLRARIFSVDSSGNFRYQFLPTTAYGVATVNATTSLCFSLLCDTTNHKIYIGRASFVNSDGSLRYAEKTPILTRYDIGGAGTAAPTFDWDFTIDSFEGGSGSINLTTASGTAFNLSSYSSLSNGLGIGHDPMIGKMFFPGGVLLDSSPGTTAGVVENWASCSDSATPTVGFLSKMETLFSSNKCFGEAACCDPTSGEVFVIPDQVNTASGTSGTPEWGVARLDPTSGVSIWTGLTTAGLQPTSVTAATYS